VAGAPGTPLPPQDCTGLLNVVYKDVDGSLSGAAAGSFVVASNMDAVNSTCRTVGGPERGRSAASE
jgi:hypothetical protein